MATEEAPDRRLTVLLAIAVEGGLVLLAWVMGWLLGPMPLDRFAWTVEGAVWGLLGTVPMILLFLVMILFPVGPLGRIKRFSEEVIRPLLASCSVLDMLGISLLAGLGEEMLFRGVFQAAFSAWLPFWLALALASLLFGLLHAITPTYAFLATLMGAYLGWLWVASGNLLAPILAHGLYDFLVLLYLLRGPGSDAPLPEEKGEGEDIAEEDTDQ